MTDIAVLSVPIEADTRQLDAALRRVERELDRAGRGGRGAQIGEPFARAVPNITRAEQATIRFAQARARYATQAGDLAGAERILAGALRQTTVSTSQTLGAQTQLLRIQQQLAGSGRGAAEAIGAQTSRIQQLVGVAAGLGGAFAAVGAASAAVDIARVGASAELARASFERMAAGAGTAGDVLLRDLQAASKGTVAQIDLIRSSNTALLLLGNDVATKLPQLLAVATASAQTLGTDVGQVFDSLVTGISRGSTELIDNAGITVKAAEAYQAYAAQIGKSADSLSAAEKQQAILNAVLTSGQDIIARTSGGASEGALAIQQFDAALKDLQTTGAGFVAQVGAPLAQALADLARKANEGAEQTQASGGVNAAALDPLIQASYESLTGAVRAYADAQIAAGASTGAAVNAAMGYAKTLDVIAIAQRGSVDAGEQSAAAAAALAARMTEIASSGPGAELTIRALATAYSDGRLSIEELTGSLAAMEAGQQSAAIAAASSADAQAMLSGYTEDATAAADAQAAMLDYSAQAAAAQEAALRSAAQAAYEAEAADGDLEAAARAAAAALLDAGPAGAQAAAQLASSSADIDVMTAAFYRLEAAKRAALGGGGALGNLGGVVKGAGQATAAIRALNKVYGAGPLAPRPTGGARGGGGGGGGASAAARAAETQQREQAGLYERLAGIQERYHEQTLTAEQRYQERLADIAAEFAQRRAEAERSFADAQVGGRADFYTSLASADKADRTQLITEYEDAQARAAEIASTQGADAGERYLDEITGIIRDRLQRQKQIQEALEGGDDAEAEFLRGVDRIAREAEQRRLDAVTGGGDGLAAEERAAVEAAGEDRAEALADAQLTAQDALAEAEGRKADVAMITNEQLQRQLDLTREIVRAGGVALPAATPAAQPAPAATSPAAGGLPGVGATGGPVEVRDSEVIATLAQVAAALDGVRRAVQAGGHTRPGV